MYFSVETGLSLSRMWHLTILFAQGANRYAPREKTQKAALHKHQVQAVSHL